MCMLGEMKLVLKLNFESLPSFEPSLFSLLSMSKRTLISRYEEGTRFFCTIQVCQTQWDHFQYKTLCFWWCIYSCYSLHSIKSLRILQSVSSGLKLLNTLAHCCANEISDLGKSAYLNYAKTSSCRLLCINALLMHPYYIQYSEYGPGQKLKNWLRNWFYWNQHPQIIQDSLVPSFYTK